MVSQHFLLNPKPPVGWDAQHVLITGGSEGIGLALAQLFLERNASVSLVSRNRAKLRAALQQLRLQAGAAEDRIFTHTADVASFSEAISEFCHPPETNIMLSTAERCTIQPDCHRPGPRSAGQQGCFGGRGEDGTTGCDHCKRWDALEWCARLSWCPAAGSSMALHGGEAVPHATALFEELSVEDYEAIFRCNFMGVVHTLKAGTAGMLKRYRACILVVSPVDPLVHAMPCHAMPSVPASCLQAARPHCDCLIPVGVRGAAGPDSLFSHEVCAARLCRRAPP